MNQPKTALSAWCAARGLTAADLVRLTGCSLRAAQRWLAGQQAPGPLFRERLYRATGLDVFAPPSPRGPSTGHVTSRPAAAGPAGASPRARGDYAPEARALLTALGELEAALRPFAQGPVTARDYLRRAVDPSRVARVTNLAQLLFDEEAFTDWLLLDTALGGEDG